MNEEQDLNSDTPHANASDEFAPIQNPNIGFHVQLENGGFKLSELTQMAAGDLVLLDQPVAEDLSIVVDNRVVAYAKLVSVSGRYAVRISRVLGD